MTAAVSYVEIAESEYGLHRLPHLGRFGSAGSPARRGQSLREEPCWQMETGGSTKTLVKYPDLRIVPVTMRARTKVRHHRTNARIAVIALSGHIRLHLPPSTVELPAGELLALDRSSPPHDVEAIRPRTFLLIISWPNSAPNRDLRDPEDRVVDEDDAREIREKMLDKTIADSFPASDPPSTDPSPLADSFAAKRQR